MRRHTRFLSLRSRGFSSARLAVLVGWTVAWGAVLVWAWFEGSAPANAFAKELTLGPKAVGYGPIRLSVISSETLVITGPRDIRVVSLPGLTYADASTGSAGSPDGPPAVLTEAELSRWLIGTSAPSGAMAAEIKELWGLIANASDEGLSTRVERFRLLGANPWSRSRWLRRIWWNVPVLWVLGAAAVWRWGRA